MHAIGRKEKQRHKYKSAADASVRLSTPAHWFEQRKNRRNEGTRHKSVPDDSVTNPLAPNSNEEEAVNSNPSSGILKIK